MPQTKYDVPTTLSKEEGKELVANTESVQGVKFVNVSVDGTAVIVTHGDDYDEATFKAAAGI